MTNIRKSYLSDISLEHTQFTIVQQQTLNLI